MKIRDPRSLRRLARLAAVAARGWLHTLRYAYRPLTEYLMGDRPHLLGERRFIYAFWHEYLFVPSYVFARPDTAVLIGLHADGELLTHINESFGFKVIRGSSTRGGTTALLRMLRDGGSRHFGLTPDGPKGPRRKCQFGAVYLASRTGLPIVPVGFGYSRAWRADNWDRFALPLPFSRVRCVSAHPVNVPGGLSTARLEPYQREVERATQQATDIAERWATTGTFDPLGFVPPTDAGVVPSHHRAWDSPRLVRRKAA